MYDRPFALKVLHRQQQQHFELLHPPATPLPPPPPAAVVAEVFFFSFFYCKLLASYAPTPPLSLSFPFHSCLLPSCYCCYPVRPSVRLPACLPPPLFLSRLARSLARPHTHAHTDRPHSHSLAPSFGSAVCAGLSAAPGCTRHTTTFISLLLPHQKEFVVIVVIIFLLIVRVSATVLSVPRVQKQKVTVFKKKKKVSKCEIKWQR